MDLCGRGKNVKKLPQRRFSLPAGLELSSAGETLLQQSSTPRAMTVAGRAPDIRMNRALVIVSCMAEAEDFQRHLPIVRYPDIQFIYPNDISTEPMSYDALMVSCKEVLDDEDVDFLVCIHPYLILVHASLLAQYSHLKGPSFESTFLCTHRYYCRRYITHGFNNNYSLLELDDITPSQITGVLDDLSSPALFMEAYNCTHNPVYMEINRCKTLWKEINDIKEKVHENVKILSSLITDKVDNSRYNFVNEAVCVVEEIKTHSRRNKRDHEDVGLYMVECCILDGDIIPFVISDVNYWTDYPQCKKSISMPTAMSEPSQFEVWAVVREVMEKLVSFGFRNSFANITIQINTDGSVRIHNIFPGVLYDNIPLSRFVYQNGDTLRTCCDLSLDQEPRHLKMRPRHFAMKVFLTLNSSGPLKELVDLQKLKSDKHATLTVSDDVILQMISDHLVSKSRTPTPVSQKSHNFRVPTPGTGRTTPNTSLCVPGSSGSRPNSRSPSPGVLENGSSRSLSISPDAYSTVDSHSRGQSSGRNSTSIQDVSEALSATSEEHSMETSKEVEDICAPVLIADENVGINIGYYYAFGSTEEECTEQTLNFLRSVLKKDAVSPWLRCR